MTDMEAADPKPARQPSRDGEPPAGGDEERRQILEKYGDAPVFSGLDQDQLVAFVRSCDEEEIPRGRTFIEEGDHGHRMYFFHRGKVRVFTEDGGEHELAVLRAPMVVGELEFLTREPRAASVQTLKPAVGISLSFEALSECLEQRDPGTLRVLFHTAQVIARRLTAMNRKFAELENRTPGTRFDELREFQQKLMTEWSV